MEDLNARLKLSSLTHIEKKPHIFFGRYQVIFFFFPSETRTFVARMLLFLSSTQLSLFPFLLVLSFPSPILQLSGHEISEEREKDLILTESRCVPHTCSTYILSFSPWWQPSERYCFRHFFAYKKIQLSFFSCIFIYYKKFSIWCSISETIFFVFSSVTSGG